MRRATSFLDPRRSVQGRLVPLLLPNAGRMAAKRMVARAFLGLLDEVTPATDLGMAG
jgi:hypothetical protein